MAKKRASKRPPARKRHVNGSAEAPVPPLNAVPHVAKGTLIIIGGNENKDGHKPILEEVARHVGRGKLLIATFASEEPEELWEEYRKLFAELGVKRIEQLDARTREEMLSDPQLDRLAGATAVFFCGGDQLKITSRFGGTQLCDRIRHIYADGGIIAGTSSGAAVMSETMMIASNGHEGRTGLGSLRMAPGLGFIPGVIVDQHFAERGRIGRLVAAVSQNPRMLGIGIDEDTAICVDGQRRFTVLGSGAVYVIDGSRLSYTDVAEDAGESASMYGLTLHVLTTFDTFDLHARMPLTAPQQKKNQLKEKRREEREEKESAQGGEEARA
jgi:cyanophycinase